MQEYKTDLAKLLMKLRREPLIALDRSFKDIKSKLNYISQEFKLSADIQVFTNLAESRELSSKINEVQQAIREEMARRFINNEQE